MNPGLLELSLRAPKAGFVSQWREEIVAALRGQPTHPGHGFTGTRSSELGRTIPAAVATPTTALRFSWYHGQCDGLCIDERAAEFRGHGHRLAADDAGEAVASIHLLPLRARFFGAHAPAPLPFPSGTAPSRAPAAIPSAATAAAAAVL
jgi:hypothetical protein